MITIQPIYFVGLLALVGVLVGIASGRTKAYEIIMIGTFFFLLGTTPAGEALVHGINSIHSSQAPASASAGR